MNPKVENLFNDILHEKKKFYGEKNIDQSIDIYSNTKKLFMYVMMFNFFFYQYRLWYRKIFIDQPACVQSRR